MYLVVHISSGKQYVLKEVQCTNAQQKTEALKEVTFLKALKHPNIIGYREAFESPRPIADPTNAGRGRGGTRPGDLLYIAMSYADGGDLTSKIKQRMGKPFAEQQVRIIQMMLCGKSVCFRQWISMLFTYSPVSRLVLTWCDCNSQVVDWFLQLCLAMKHIHDRKIIHRDLKSQNIFLMSNNTIKLGDFGAARGECAIETETRFLTLCCLMFSFTGIARSLSHTQDHAQTQIGTPYYLSPEICQDKPYDQKSDIWSLGTKRCSRSCVFRIALTT